MVAVVVCVLLVSLKLLWSPSLSSHLLFFQGLRSECQRLKHVLREWKTQSNTSRRQKGVPHSTLGHHRRRRQTGSGSMCSEVKSQHDPRPCRSRNLHRHQHRHTHSTPFYCFAFFISRRSRHRYGPCGPTVGERRPTRRLTTGERVGVRWRPTHNKERHGVEAAFVLPASSCCLHLGPTLCLIGCLRRWRCCRSREYEK